MRTRALTAAVLCLASAAVRADAPADTPPPPLAIAELGADAKELKWADVKTPGVAIALTLQNTSADEVKDVRVEVTPLTTLSQSIPLSVKVDDKPYSKETFSIAKGGSVPIALSATLNAGGTYHGRLMVLQGPKVVVNVALEIARTRVAAPVDITVPSAKALELVPGRPNAKAFTITLTGSGEPVTLNDPIETSVEFRETADAKATLATDANVTFEPSSSLTVDTPQSVVATVGNIRAPGRYDVVVRFGGDGYAKATATLTIHARQSAWIASLCILVGLATSWVIRYYSTIGRPVLQNKERAARLFSELDESATLAAGDPHALALVQDVRRRLVTKWERLAAENQLANATALDIHARKNRALPLWLQLWARLKRVQPAAVAEKFRAQLLTAETMFRDVDATDEDVNTKIATLTGMPLAIDNDIMATLRDQVREVRERTGSDPRFAAVAADAQAAADRLAAHDAIDRLPEIAAQVERLRLRYFAAAADDLTGRVALTPLWAGDSWPAAAAAVNAGVARIRAATTSADAALAYKETLTTYLRTVVDGLLLDIAGRIDPGPGVEKSAHAAQYELVKTKLETIPPLIAKGDLAAAWTELQAAQNDYNQIRAAARGGAMGGAAAMAASAHAEPMAAAFDITSIVLGASRVEEVSEPEAFPIIAAKRSFWDVVVTIAIAVAAVLAGLQTLWFGDATWGGPRAMLAAFLWGLAFDQFSYAGLAAVLKRT